MPNVNGIPFLPEGWKRVIVKYNGRLKRWVIVWEQADNDAIDTWESEGGA
jgi:hypothetical protein